MTRTQLWSRILVLVLVALGACDAPPLATVHPRSTREIVIPLVERAQSKVDILFMVDNSMSMKPMQGELQARFGEFLKVFRDAAAMGHNADLHIGVVTSDYGAGATGAGQLCGKSPGDGGKLQALGKDAAPGCVAPVGASFIKYQFQGANQGVGNLPGAQTLEQTFTCMASVGASGCGYEHQLESVYAALHNILPENAGFLRPEELLAVVFVTNEDDSSAPPDTMIFDFNGANNQANYGYASSYRQTRFGVVCGEPPSLPPLMAASSGPLSRCLPAPNPPGGEFDVKRYIDFFAQPASRGGVKDDPRDVWLIALDAPETPFEVILARNPNALTVDNVYEQCATLNFDPAAGPICAPALQHSCHNPVKRQFFGDPAVRLNAVVRSARGGHQISSICEDSYSQALKSVAEQILITIGAGCVTGALPAQQRCSADGTSCADVTCAVDGDCGDSRTRCHHGRCLNPDCVIEEQTGDVDHPITTQISRCDLVGGVTPCWRLDDKPSCQASSPDSVGITIDRGGAAAPAHANARIACTVVAE